MIEPQGHGSQVVPVRLDRDRAGAAAGSPEPEMGPEPQPGPFLCARNLPVPRVAPLYRSASLRFSFGGPRYEAAVALRRERGRAFAAPGLRCH